MRAYFVFIPTLLIILCVSNCEPCIVNRTKIHEHATHLRLHSLLSEDCNVVYSSIMLITDSNLLYYYYIFFFALHSLVLLWQCEFPRSSSPPFNNWDTLHSPCLHCSYADYPQLILSFLQPETGGSTNLYVSGWHLITNCCLRWMSCSFFQGRHFLSTDPCLPLFSTLPWLLLKSLNCNHVSLTFTLLLAS